MDDLTRAAVAAQRGGPAELAALVRAGYPQVWTLCAHLVDPESADDLAQESYLRICRALPGFRRDAPARTWMLAIARRTCMDELRTRVRRRGREQLAAAPPERPAPVADDPPFAVRSLLARLEPERRAAFALTQLLGLGYDDAAAVLGCPPGTVRSRVARARTELIRHAGGAPEEGHESDAR
ncbi:sigma-70 family RNA polymerase sigma factor [Pseudonocardia spirodelae]|uniref:Sigma-70 family RNA polymerase sigma factor n=1 Tax=Pseudonocardia spirodelae TaxID=3133431 RepID=A0ABU8TEE4_9PSEU